MRTEGGGFRQAEVTSCGLNGGPLSGVGEYPARIACNLWSREGTARYDRKFNKKLHPYFTQDKKDDDHSAIQYIANMQDGSVAGFKYFDIRHADGIRICFAGSCDGKMEVSDDPAFTRICASVPARNSSACTNETADLHIEPGVRALYFRYTGQGALNFYSFELQDSAQA